MNISEIAHLLKERGHKNAYHKLNFLTKGALAMLPSDSLPFIDDAIELMKDQHKQDLLNLQEQRKAYLKKNKK